MSVTRQSITQNPVNFEKCSGCAAQLPPKIPRLYQVRIPDLGEHKHSFWCGACQSKALKEGGAE